VRIGTSIFCAIVPRAGKHTNETFASNNYDLTVHSGYFCLLYVTLLTDDFVMDMGAGTLALGKKYKEISSAEPL